MPGDMIEVEIVRLGAHGDGIAETPEGNLFVPGALPGERVRVEREGQWGRLREVLQSSPARIAPICTHFGSCGGCSAQHIGGAVYPGWKRQMVVDAFRHVGLDPDVGETVGVGAHSRRRAVLTVRRFGSSAALGYSAEGTHDLVAINQCPVLVPALEAALPALRMIAGIAMGSAKEARLTVLAADLGFDVDIAGLPPVTEPERRAILARQCIAAGVVRLIVGGDPVMMGTAPGLDFGGVRVALPPAGFVQASATAEQALRQIAIEAAGKSKKAADLFCGAGAFTFALAARAEVLAVDSDAGLLAGLAEGARFATGRKRITTKLRDLFQEPLSRKELEPFDVVVMDPPRAGAKAQSEALARSKVPLVVAISCNPATLARDARILVDGGYAIERVAPVDQFVYAQHVEAVAVFRRTR